MTNYSLDSFVKATAQDSAANQLFELENPYMLEVNLNGRVWAKVGAMVAYTGQVKFTREGVLEQGLSRMLKKMVTGEGTALMKAEGRGRVYLADRGKKVRLLNLQRETIFVNGNDLLAFQDGVEWDISMIVQCAPVRHRPGGYHHPLRPDHPAGNSGTAGFYGPQRHRRMVGFALAGYPHRHLV
jgi:uncharacterized protein (AIM24 family)